MTFEEQLSQVLPTFPSDDVIHCLNEDLKSGEYHIIISRMDKAALDALSTLRNISNEMQQMIFPFEDGITMADILDIKKEIGEPPMMVTRIPKSRMTYEQIITAFLPDPKAREELLADTKLVKYMTLCFIHPNDAKGWKWAHDYVMTKHELNNTEILQQVEINDQIECLPRPLSFVKFYEGYDEVTRDYLLKLDEHSNINPSVRLYSESDQTVATFYIHVPSGSWARLATEAMEIIVKTHEWDYYVKITEAWMSLKKIENSKPGDATKLPRNEKKECLMVVARTKQGEVKRISYEIVRECPEDDSSKILKFEPLTEENKK